MDEKQTKKIISDISSQQLAQKETTPPLPKPKNFLQDAIKPFVGKKKIEDLVEEFTDEVTLVTEGLWNDQKKIRDQMNNVQMEQSLWEKKEEEARIALRDEMEALSKKIDTLSERIKDLETKKKKGKNEKGFLFQVSLMVFVASGAWVLVTLINALVP